MLVGVPREVKNHEYRMAITPAGVGELTRRGHTVLLERDAGAGAGLPDEEFVAAGACINEAPVFRVHDSTFYCVANMPAAVPNTSTRALTNVTLPYVVVLADRGITTAVSADPALAAGLNVAAGRVVLPEVGAAHGMPVAGLGDVVDALPGPR